jgi:hypothetical protein
VGSLSEMGSLRVFQNTMSLPKQFAHIPDVFVAVVWSYFGGEMGEREGIAGRALGQFLGNDGKPKSDSVVGLPWKVSHRSYPVPRMLFEWGKVPQTSTGSPEAKQHTIGHANVDGDGHTDIARTKRIFCGKM